MSLLSQLPILSILSPFISLMGFIINYIYKFLLLFGITKVAICIIVFTIVTKVLMIPLTYKQQKFTKVSARMNPEIQALQEKYRGKRDQESMTKMQMEQRAIYKKYGTSPMSGCLPMIVLMILLFALYPVVYSVPSHVDDIKEHYLKVQTALVRADENELPATIKSEKNPEVEYNLSDAVYAFYTANKVYVRSAPKYSLGTTNYYKDGNGKVINKYVTIMSNFSKKNWEDFYAGKTEGYEDIKMKKGDIEAWILYAPHIKEALSHSYYELDGKVYTEKVDGATEVSPVKAKNDIIGINTFIGLNIFDTPTLKNITIIIPILAAAFQFLQMQISMLFQKKNMKSNKKNNAQDPMSSMKTMNYIMPIFSGIICLSVPIGVGIYWITSSIVSLLLQVIIDLKLQNVEVEEFIEESDAKQDKYLEKHGLHKNNDGQMAKVATMTTKTIADKAKSVKSSEKNKNNNSLGDGKIPEKKRHYSASNISAIANLYNSDYDNDEQEEETNSDISEKGDKE